MVIQEPPDVPAQRVAATVQRDWGVAVTEVAFTGVEGRGWHWTVADDAGPAWSASLDPVRTSQERRTRVAGLEAAVEVGRRLATVVAPVVTRDARVAVDLAPGLLLTVTPHVAGVPLQPGKDVGLDDEARSLMAASLGELHRMPRPRVLPRWRPRSGLLAPERTEELERCLDVEDWSAGPWSSRTGALLVDAGPVVRRTLRRFTLLAAAVVGHADRWVLTHGEPDPDQVLSTAEGPRLVGWGSTALAPRERDLGDALGCADGPDPWLAYVGAGGRPDPLSPDTVELFWLERRLSRVVEHVSRFARPHEDTPDERHRFTDLEDRICELAAHWS